MIFEIKSEEEFKHFKSLREGYIVITDTATGDKVHTTRCEHVTISNFREKVLVNEQTNGQYFFTDSLVDAWEELGAKKCGDCRPK